MQLSDLSSQMRVDVIVNPDGKIWFLHDKPLNHRIEWIEYDQEEKSIAFVTDDGLIQNLGMQATDIMDKYLIKGENANLAFVENGKIISKANIAITIRKK